jgi:NAD(P)-dependent dehydrogenase (short-subunit alcohol dehydrogenase family)
MAEKKVAFITGANRGIGFETARELGEQGITVVLGSRDLAKGEAAAASLREKGIDAEVVRYDSTDPATDGGVAKFIEDRYGKLDILVNNAGIMKDEQPRSDTVLTITREALRETYETNLFAVVSLTQTLLPLLRKAPAARIVNVSSILGSLTLHSAPDSPLAFARAFAYNSSKTALNAFTVHLAMALKGTAIKVNSAHPGWVKTELGGSDAMLEVSEGGKTSAQLATIGEDGPTAGYFHLGESLPW